jgi:hypothetical protein
MKLGEKINLPELGANWQKHGHFGIHHKMQEQRKSKALGLLITPIGIRRGGNEAWCVEWLC